MIRSSTVGSRRSAVAAALSMSKNAEDLTVVAKAPLPPILTTFTSTIRPPSNQVDRSPLSGYSALPHVAHLETQKHGEKKESKRISVGKVDQA
ncbi:hypothetical protein F25303_13858 [Fusarium sp. NRRL 25303]|nr:hypothetical protein F25303_13858 [Fusarium sp. NRRL 25303]